MNDFSDMMQNFHCLSMNDFKICILSINEYSSTQGRNGKENKNRAQHITIRACVELIGTVIGGFVSDIDVSLEWLKEGGKR